MTNRKLIALALATLSLASIIYWLVRQDKSEPKPAPASSRIALPAVVSPSKAGGQLDSIARNRRDETVWVKELFAQKHEDVFIKLWDQLRAGPDPASLLEKFAFGELLLGIAGQAAATEHGIAVRRFGGSVERLKPAAWQQLIGKLKQQGCQLEQSEWRHAQFTISTNGFAESVFAISLHALNAQKEERFIVRGELRVKWRKNEPADAKPFPELIDATNLELLSRQGQTPFHHVVAADITPEKLDALSMEPSLQLYDLDGDGLSEIILGGRNLVFWNKGKGVFRQEPLCQFPLPAMNTGIFADFDGDGLADFLCVDQQGLILFSGDAQGHFPSPGRKIRFTERALDNPLVMTAGDIDHDGDLDVWLAQYKVPYQRGQMPTPYYDANDGYPSFLLINDGEGNFQDGAEAAGLATKRFRRTYSCSFVDLDNDGDLDLVVVSDFAGVDLYYNDGRGHFSDVTATVLDESHAFGMAHTLGDYDGDGNLDLFVIGMNSFVANRLDHLNLGPTEFPEYQRMRPKMAFGNRMFFRRGSFFRPTPLSEQVARSGWSWGATSGDFDNDGDLDIYIVNGHISGQTAKDYESLFWRHDIYAGTSKDDPVLGASFLEVASKHYRAGQSYGGFEKNRFFLNQSGKSFLEVGYFMGVAMEEDGRNAVSDDLDGDGKLDLLVTTFQAWPSIHQALHLFPNFSEDVGNWIGVRLRESGPGFSPVGARIILTTAAGKQIRQFVTGDSFRSQHANTAHFGLGKETQVNSVEVVWPNGQKKFVLNPEINRYYLVTPGQ
ncbi:MAG: FG-GAP-like repeat-containing protein [Verrucomicrobiota bacterium]